mmetsp:Transcript_51818/g.118194  ORF Transcript_51818/g.118194 Transcript_51818/m.118194 type:complete len:219 (+) Transcript_51818:555-1211(+)
MRTDWPPGPRSGFRRRVHTGCAGAEIRRARSRERCPIRHLRPLRQGEQGEEQGGQVPHALRTLRPPQRGAATGGRGGERGAREREGHSRDQRRRGFARAPGPGGLRRGGHRRGRHGPRGVVLDPDPARQEADPRWRPLPACAHHYEQIGGEHGAGRHTLRPGAKNVRQRCSRSAVYPVSDARGHFRLVIRSHVQRPPPAGRGGEGAAPLRPPARVRHG